MTAHLHYFVLTNISSRNLQNWNIKNGNYRRFCSLWHIPKGCVIFGKSIAISINSRYFVCLLELRPLNRVSHGGGS